MSAALLEAPTPQLLRRIVDGRWALCPQRPVPVQRLPAPPAPQAEQRLRRRTAESGPGPLL